MDRPRTPSREELAAEQTPEAQHQAEIQHLAEALLVQFLTTYTADDGLRIVNLVHGALIGNVAKPEHLYALIDRHCFLLRSTAENTFRARARLEAGLDDSAAIADFLPPRPPEDQA